MNLFKIKPYDYQLKAIHFGYNSMLRHKCFAALMEMGTGKTLVNIYIAELLQQFNGLEAIIIIPPKMLIKNWVEELNDKSLLEPSFNFWSNQKPLFPYKIKNYKDRGIEVIFINIEIFSRKNDYLKDFLKGMFELNNCFVILDESTKIKNPKAQRTKNAVVYNREAQYKSILTGTEITTSLLDLYAQFEFLKKGFFGVPNFWVFRSMYADLQDVRIPGRKPFKKVVGFRRMAELQSKITHCTFRALKKDCLDLPDKVFQTIKIEPTKEQLRVYEDLKNDLLAEFKNHTVTVQQKVVLFLRFRQVAGGFMPETNDLLSSKKLDFIIEDTEDYNHKVVIWAVFKAEINYIHSKLKNSVKYTGDETTDQKNTAVDRFKNDPEIKYIVLTPQSAAFGLNFQFCNLVYKYSRITSPELEKQSIDRTHRIGTTNKVTYKILETAGTVDERVSSILENRELLSDTFRSNDPEEFFKLI